jgi:hypothetical protein
MHPEKTLWRAVVHRAFLDATQDLERLKLGMDRRRAETERAQARAWLLGGGTDFLEVCAMASLDGDKTRAQARAVAANGWRLLEGMAETFDVKDWVIPGDHVDQRTVVDEAYVYF